MDFKKALADLSKALPDEQQQAIAAQLDALGQALEPYAGLDPQAARDAIAAQATRVASDQQTQAIAAERDTFRQQLADTQTEALNAKKEVQAVRGLVAAGVRPEYEELLLPRVLNGLEVNDDGAIAVPEGMWDSLKTSYPAMFHADDAAGTGTTTGETSTTAPAAVPVTNGIISGADPGAVLAGGVSVQ
ncbi:hypothetical protein IQ273_31270 [Nodosilinea sp. LEGE 07298]|uniref:hypothetical protein n=1 Tax=Nodosilinea sp. LEGE 07298 TaxID=2777970 RepID=UPI00187E8E26|nr:hypothetical protein [Nodosilinea sp. LEGE 07298]MBE9113854.1 hypothetical protein [Nodosilinea sp. LEGE 07298]